MKLIRKISAAITAVALAAGMMSMGASASTPYNWTLSKTYGQPTSSVSCKGYVYNLSTSYDDAIDFVCNTMSNNYCDVQFDITSSMKLDSNQKAFLYYVSDTDDIKFKSGWYSAYVANGNRCTVNGKLFNDTSTTFTATGSAS